MSQPNSQTSGKQKKVCKYFQKGECAFGSGCSLSHDTDEVKKLKIRTTTKPKKTSSIESAAKNDTVIEISEDSSRKSPCLFQSGGRCSKGDTCTFSHSAETSDSGQSKKKHNGKGNCMCKGCADCDSRPVTATEKSAASSSVSRSPADKYQSPSNEGRTFDKIRFNDGFKEHDSPKNSAVIVDQSSAPNTFVNPTHLDKDGSHIEYSCEEKDPNYGTLNPYYLENYTHVAPINDNSHSFDLKVDSTQEHPCPPVIAISHPDHPRRSAKPIPNTHDRMDTKVESTSPQSAPGRARESTSIQYPHVTEVSPHWSQYADPLTNSEMPFCKAFARGQCRLEDVCSFRHSLSIEEYTLLFHDLQPNLWTLDPRALKSTTLHAGISVEKREPTTEYSAPSNHNSERGPSEKPSLPCKYFPNGNCRNGDTCPYSHGNSNTIFQTRDNPNRIYDWPRNSNAAEYFGICKYHAEWGYCIRGDSCRYRHDAPTSDGNENHANDTWNNKPNHGKLYPLVDDPKMEEANDKGWDIEWDQTPNEWDHMWPQQDDTDWTTDPATENQGNTWGFNNNEETHRNNTASNGACRFFLRGDCRKGKSCRFFHAPVDSEVPTYHGRDNDNNSYKSPCSNYVSRSQSLSQKTPPSTHREHEAPQSSNESMIDNNFSTDVDKGTACDIIEYKQDQESQEMGFTDDPFQDNTGVKRQALEATEFEDEYRKLVNWHDIEGANIAFLKSDADLEGPVGYEDDVSQEDKSHREESNNDVLDVIAQIGEGKQRVEDTMRQEKDAPKEEHVQGEIHAVTMLDSDCLNANGHNGDLFSENDANKDKRDLKTAHVPEVSPVDGNALGNDHSITSANNEGLENKEETLPIESSDDSDDAKTVEDNEIEENEKSWRQEWPAEAPGPSGPRRKKLPCLRFGQGFCEYGEECIYLHIRQLEERSAGADPPRVAIPSVQIASPLPAAARTVEVARNPVDHPLIERSFFGCNVRFNAEVIPEDISTAAESTQIILDNFPLNASTEDVRGLVQRYGEVTGALRVEQLENSAIFEVIFHQEDQARNAVLHLHRQIYDSQEIQARLNARCVVDVRSPFESQVVMFSWPAPSVTVWAFYATIGKAKAEATRMDGLMIDKRNIKAEFHSPRKNKKHSFSVQLSGISPDTEKRALESLCGAVTIDVGKPTYAESPVRAIGALLPEYGEVREFDVIKEKGFDSMLFAKFSSANMAANAVKDMKGNSYEFLGSQTMVVQHVFFRRYKSIPRLFRTLISEIDKLREHYQKDCQILYDQNAESVDIRIYSSIDRTSSFGEANLALIKLLLGEPVMDSNGTFLWDDYFSTASSIKTLDKLNSELSFILPDSHNHTITIYGSDTGREHAKGSLVRLMKRIRASKLEITVNRPLLQTLVHGGFSALEDDLGSNKAVLAVLDSKIIVRGENDTLERAQTVISSALLKSKGQAVVKQVRDDICQICLCKSITPVIMPCKHTFCTECLKNALQYAVAWQSADVTCVAQETNDLGSAIRCRARVPYTLVRDFLPMIQEADYLEHSFLSHVRTHPKTFFFCPTPKCKGIYRKAEEGFVLKCSSCLCELCAKCASFYHDGLTCSEYQQAITKLP